MALQIMSVKQGRDQYGSYVLLDVAGLDPSATDSCVVKFYRDALPDRRKLYGLAPCADCSDPASCEHLNCEGGKRATRAILREHYGRLNPTKLADLGAVAAKRLVQLNGVPGKTWDAATERVVNAPSETPEAVVLDLGDVLGGA